MSASAPQQFEAGPVVIGAAIGVSLSLVTLFALNSSYRSAKSKASVMDPHAARLARESTVTNERAENCGAFDTRTQRRQHVVFLLGAPLLNRTIIAQRLTRNRHLAGAHGAPVALEFDECVASQWREKIERGVALSDEEIEHMIDDVIVKVQKAADDCPVIFSAFLPLGRLRKRILRAFEDKTIVRLVSAGDMAKAGAGVDESSLRRVSTYQSASVAGPLSDEIPLPVTPDPADSKYDRSWCAADSNAMSLEALVMLDKATDEELRSRLGGKGGNEALVQETRRALRLRWLSGQFEEIDEPHHKIDAARSLHEVAKDVRVTVVKAVMHCSERSTQVVKFEAVPEYWVSVGGTGGVVSVCASGALVGGILGVIRQLKAFHSMD